MCRIRSGRAAVRGVRSRCVTSPAVSGTATTPSSATRLGGAAVATMPGATGRVSSTPTRWVVGMGRTPSSRRGRVRCHIVDGRRRARNAFKTPHAGRRSSHQLYATWHHVRDRDAAFSPSWYDARIGEQGQQRFYFHPVGTGFHRFLCFWGYTSESSHFSQPRA